METNSIVKRWNCLEGFGYALKLACNVNFEVKFVRVSMGGLMYSFSMRCNAHLFMYVYLSDGVVLVREFLKPTGFHARVVS